MCFLQTKKAFSIIRAETASVKVNSIHNIIISSDDDDDDDEGIGLLFMH